MAQSRKPRSSPTARSWVATLASPVRPGREGHRNGLAAATTSLAWNIHVPINCFRNEWDLLAKGQDFDSLAPKTARLGIIFVAETEGVEVDSIEAGSGADKAGLKPGDALLKLRVRGTPSIRGCSSPAPAASAG